jgi:hypothetical protein
VPAENLARYMAVKLGSDEGRTATGWPRFRQFPSKTRNDEAEQLVKAFLGMSEPVNCGSTAVAPDERERSDR